MSAESLAIGIDIGGTKIAAALVTQSGAVLARHRVATHPQDGIDAVIDRIADSIRVLQAQMPPNLPLAGIGIGSPGLVDPVAGVVNYSVNLGWRDVPLKSALQARLQTDALPIYLQRDTNAITIGEYAFGAASGQTDVVHIAIGTGIGMGAISGGYLVVGARALAMELGHVGLDVVNGRACPCGLRGCPEMYISGVGLLASAQHHLPAYPHSPLAATPQLTTAAILDAAHHQDPLALVIVDEAVMMLAQVLAMSAAVFNPALVVIGGGLGTALYPLIIAPLQAALALRLLPAVYESLQITGSQIEDSALGAAALVWHPHITRS